MTKLIQKWGTDDFVEEWPRSGERLTKDASTRLAESYGEMSGTSPRFTYKRMLGGGDVVVVEGTVDYGDGVPVSYVGIGEMRDGRISKMTEYFANPFPAPEWRAVRGEDVAGLQSENPGPLADQVPTPKDDRSHEANPARRQHGRRHIRTS